MVTLDSSLCKKIILGVNKDNNKYWYYFVSANNSNMICSFLTRFWF